MAFRKKDERRIADATVIVEQRVQNPHLSRARWFKHGAGERIVGFKTAVQHPGKGIAFNVYVGIWNPPTNDYSNYDEANPVKAIDQRTGVPTPAACATGWGWYRPSDEFGRIIYIGDLDCTSPGC